MGGDSDGAGGIPFAGSPVNPIAHSGTTLLTTIGRVEDLQGAGISGLSLVVTCAKGDVVAAGMTDAEGFFVLGLPVEVELELAILGTGVADVPVEAGVPVLIVLP
jgi:hypothetical protein